MTIRLTAFCFLLAFNACNYCGDNNCNMDGYIRVVNLLGGQSIIGKYRNGASWRLMAADSTQQLEVHSSGINEQFYAYCDGTVTYYPVDCKRFNYVEMRLSIADSLTLVYKVRPNEVILTLHTYSCERSSITYPPSVIISSENLTSPRGDISYGGSFCPETQSSMFTSCQTPLGLFEDVVEINGFDKIDRLCWSRLNGPVSITLNDTTYDLVDFRLF